MKNKLFVISVDAMVHEDVEYLMAKPNFSEIMKKEKRAEVEKVCTVYPSLTFPAHTSILTRCNPGKHGIYTNQPPIKPYKDGYSHWYMESSTVRVEDIFAAAKRAGCTTASVYWPVSNNNPNVDYLIGENYYYFPKNEEFVESFVRMGTNEQTMEIIKDNLWRIPSDFIEGKFGKGPKGRYVLDDFLVGCSCSLVEKYQPDVLFVHNIYLDTLRHGHGVFSDESREALDRMDEWLGDIANSMKKAGVYEDTNFVIISDHGQMDFHRYVKINALLAKGGFIEFAPDGSIYDWRAFAKTNGFSLGVYLADPNYEAMKQKVHEYLLKLKDEGCWGIENVYTAEEVRERYGTYGLFSFVLESDGDTAFHDDWEGQISCTIDEITGYKAKHGYQPEKGPQPVFLAVGPNFKEGVCIPSAYVIDEAPTFAKILGQEMPQAEGRVLEELIR